MTKRPPGWWPQVINLPQTTTFLALLVMAGMWYYNDNDWKELVLMVLSFYFGKQQSGTVSIPTPVKVESIDDPNIR